MSTLEVLMQSSRICRGGIYSALHTATVGVIGRKIFRPYSSGSSLSRASKQRLHVANCWLVKQGVRSVNIAGVSL